MIFIKWIFGLFVAAVAAYMLFIVLNTMIQNKKKPKPFPCTYISVLKAEVEHLKSLLEPRDTGHIHTTISTLKLRIRELEEQGK